ncbi:hypothetical protein ACO0QE_002659 [Hanseniaspora vineae]
MKLFNNTCEFPYSWEQVTQGVWRKYPNEMSTHVKSVDVLDRKLSNNGTVLETSRLITCKQNIPKWLGMMLGNKDGVSYVLELSKVDLVEKKFVMKSCNLTGVNFLKVMECVKYEPTTVEGSGISRSNKTGNRSPSTIFKQEAQITAYASFQSMCSKIEDWSVKRFHENAMKGKQGFDNVLNLLFTSNHEQITSVSE